jgi:hypothetical protein
MQFSGLRSRFSPLDIACNVARHIEDRRECRLPSIGDYRSVRSMMQILNMK